MEQNQLGIGMNSFFSTIMRRITLVLVALLANSSFANDGLSSTSSYERAGLINEWYTQIEVGARSRIVNMQLQVNEDLATQYYLVEYGNTVERISQHELDAFGKIRGIEGAESHANIRKEIVMAEFASQRKNVPVTVRSITLPKSTIYVATSRGRVIAVDADTGEHIWHTSIGNPRSQTTGVGASKKYVAVVNGSTVYCLSADEGRVLWQRECNRAPSAPPSVGEYNIYVPLINGRLEVFSFARKGKLSRSFLSYGPSNTKPLLTSSTVSWSTKDGFYAVAPYRADSIQYRLNTRSNIVGSAAAADGVVYLNTVNGFIYALNEKTGSIEWEYATGDRLTQTPFVRNGSVYVISDSNRLYRIDALQGLPTKGWEKPVPGISQYVGMSKSRLYCLDRVGGLIVIDPDSGKRIAKVRGREISLVLPNIDSDRLYIGTGKGALRCFREVANTYPIFHADLGELVVDANNKPAVAKDESAAGDPFAADAEDDPFASDTEEDPFAADDDDDPFASGSDDQGSSSKNDDPFATDDSSEDEDPFGGGDDDDEDEDPFGGGGDDDDVDEDPFGGSGDDDDDPFGGF